MSREAFYDLLDRFQKGHCTEEERKIVEQWYDMLDDEELPSMDAKQLGKIDKKIWGKVYASINRKHSLRKPAKSLYTSLAVAASFLGVIIVAGYNFKPQPKQADFVVTEQIKSHTVVNNTAAPMEIALTDGSFVRLEPKAELIYPEAFAPEKREVIVNGEAFFDVAKDSLKPFYVYSNRLVTKVVGTSFIVRTNERGLPDEISVISGKVIVTKNDPNERLYTSILPGNKEEVVLTPNQRAVYQPQTNELIATLVEKPVPIIPEKDLSEISFLFQKTPITFVLNALEEKYGIKIKVEDLKIYQCSFTGDLEDQDLYARLELICQSIGAKYEIRETSIFISGGNCI